MQQLCRGKSPSGAFGDSAAAAPQNMVEADGTAAEEDKGEGEDTEGEWKFEAGAVGRSNQPGFDNVAAARRMANGLFCVPPILLLVSLLVLIEFRKRSASARR